MPSPTIPRTPRGHGGLAFPFPTMPLEDNGPPSIPSPGATDHIYQWEARTSKRTEHRFSGSARGSQVIIPVGKCRVSAPMIGWEDPSPGTPSGTIYFAFCFGVGPAESIGSFVISGQAEADINTVTMPALVRPTVNHNHGTDDQVALYYSSTLWGGGANAPRFPNLITALIGFNKRYMSGIGLPTLQADLSMQSYDFRSGTEAYTENENPILYLYTYMVMNPWGPRVPTSEIDTTSWTTAANWCDTDMDPGAGDQKRWRVGGVLDGGDVSSVISTLLESCFTTMSWQNGKWVLVPFTTRNILSPTDITADYIRRRRIGLSRRPTVVKVNFRDYNNEYTDSQAIARSADAVAGTARWVVREDSPSLINSKDVATRYAKTLLQSVSNSNRATVKVHHDVCPAVLDLKPGDNVHLSTWREKTGHGGHDYWRVESIHHQELVSELELLGDEDALSTQLTTNTSGSKPTVGRSNDVNLGTDGSVVVFDSDGDAHTALTIASDYLVIGDPNDPTEIQIYADPATLVHFNDAGVCLDNNEYLHGRDAEEVPVPLIGLDASEKVQVGSDGFALILNGTSAEIPLINGDLTLGNNGRLLGKETGGTDRQLAKVNASDEVEVGDDNVNLNLLGAQLDAVPPLANTVPILTLPTSASTDVTEDMDYTAVGGHFHDVYGVNWSIGFETGDKVIMTTDSGDNCAYNTAQGDGARFFWDEAGTFNPSTAGKVKAYAQFKTTSREGVWLQLIDATAQDGYTLSFATIAGGHGISFKLQKYIASAAQFSSGNTWGTPVSATKYWIALEVDGSNGVVRGKAWEGNKADEPVAWNLEIADSSVVNDTCKLAFVFTDDGTASRFHRAYDFALEVASSATYTETGEELAVRVNDVLTIGGDLLKLQLNASPSLGVRCLQDLDLDGSLTLADSENIFMKNGRLYWDDSGFIYGDNGTGTFSTIIGALSGSLNIGQTTGGQYRTVLYSKDYIDLTQDTRLANNKALEAAESGGTARDLIVLDGSNDIIIGNATTDTKIYGNPITSVSLHKFGDVAGGNYVEIQTDGDIIQAGTSIMQTATRIEAPEHRGKLWRTTQSKTFSNNSGFNLFQWNGTDTMTAGFLIVYQYEVVYTQSSVTKRLVETGCFTASMTNTGGTVTVAAGTQFGVAVADSGTGTHTDSIGTANGSNYGRISMTINLTSGTFVSGEIRYAVICTDIDNTAFTLFG